MPLIIDQHTTEGAYILIWKDEENLDFFLERTTLTKEDNSLLNKFQIERRKKDLVIARFLLQKHCIGAEVVYCENGKPYLKNDQYKISISHTKDIVAVIMHPNKKVAIDVEYINSKIDKLKNRFLSDAEISQANLTEKLILFWSAKESLFKFDDKQGIDFKTELSLKLNDDKLIGSIRNKNELTIRYQIKDNWIMTYIVS